MVTWEGQPVGETLACDCGDFYVDRLEPGVRCVLTVEAAGYRPVAMGLSVD